ncbi:hypothetical protein GCM10009605_55870 [Nocardiopsis composta]
MVTISTQQIRPATAYPTASQKPATTSQITLRTNLSSAIVPFLLSFSLECAAGPLPPGRVEPYDAGRGGVVPAPFPDRSPRGSAQTAPRPRAMILTAVQSALNSRQDHRGGDRCGARRPEPLQTER